MVLSMLFVARGLSGLLGLGWSLVGWGWGVVCARNVVQVDLMLARMKSGAGMHLAILLQCWWSEVDQSIACYHGLHTVRRSRGAYSSFAVSQAVQCIR